MQNKQIETKTHYRLYWEYLKRSKNYREYCIWKQEHPEIPLRKNSKGKEMTDWVHLLKALPEKFKKNKVQNESLYRLFGDIHSISFEKWWKSNKNIFEFPKLPRVRNFTEAIGSIYDEIIEQISVDLQRRVDKLR